MTKEIQPKVQYNYTPSKALVIDYPKPSVGWRIVSYLKRNAAWIFFLLIFIFINRFISIGFGLSLFFLVGSYDIIQSIRKIGLKQIIVHPIGIDYHYYDARKPYLETFVDRLDAIDFTVNVINDRAIIEVEGYEIKLENVTDFPIVIDQMTELWNLEYYDTYQIMDNKQILTYNSKQIHNYKPQSLFVVQQKMNFTRLTDSLDRKKWIEMDEKTQIIRTPLLSANIHPHFSEIEFIDLEVLTKLNFSSKSKLQINLKTTDGYYNTILTSKSRNADQKIQLYQDLELIYDLFKSISGLNNVVINKITK